MCRLLNQHKKPYLTYNILVESSQLNIPKLSKKQLSLFDKICELKNQGMNFQEISMDIDGVHLCIKIRIAMEGN